MSKSSSRLLPALRQSRRPASHSGPEQAHPSPAEVAQYIAAASAELSHLARQSKLDLLAYLLDMARIEAQQAGSGEPRR